MRGHRHWMVEKASKPLEWLARRVGLSTYLVIRSGPGVYPLWSVAPDDHTPLSPPGQGWSLHASAAGTALLMDYDRETFFEEFAETRFERYTAETPITAEHLWERVRRAKQLGYAIQIGEWDPALGAIAVPVVGPFESLAVAVSGDPERVADRAAELSRALAFTAGHLRREFRNLRIQQGAEYNVPRWLSRLSFAERHQKG
ncbi:IclR family transcriptional regulator C-terminal domain-containing protein [Arthrobacter sp. CAU 1506]|uniref:IclR family transcriptional regulator domain-containing protein n=1 Tax=Arthrobacter sp. CAU 1506 TaxID=2560052 RepID=UPI003211CE53